MSNINPSYITERRQVLGARLKDLRTRKEMSVAMVADMIGVTSYTVWKVEEGKFPCDIDLLHKYLMILDATLTIER